MKITKRQLRRIIREEVERINESPLRALEALNPGIWAWRKIPDILNVMNKYGIISVIKAIKAGDLPGQVDDHVKRGNIGDAVRELSKILENHKVIKRNPFIEDDPDNGDW